MRNTCVLLTVTSLALAGWGQGSSQKTSAPAGTPPQKRLIAEVQKRNGYVETDKKDPARPLLRIVFRLPGIKDADLQQLRPLLQESAIPVFLSLSQCGAITDAGVAHLKNLTTLQGLGLGGTKVTDAGLAHLAGMTNLEVLYLANDRISDAGLVHLAKLAKLRQLSIYCKKVTDAGYAHLAGLTQLEELHAGDIGHEVGDLCLSHMKAMTKLKELRIGAKQLSDAGMTHVKNFTELRELHIEAPKVTQAGLANLAALQRLEKLTILSCPAINGDGMSALKGLASLRELEIVYCGTINSAATVHLKGLTHLKKLRFDAVEDDALKGIKGLTNLEELSLFYTSVGDPGLQYLSGLTGLRELNLMRTKVTDAGLKHLGGLTNLQTLNLGDNKITDDGLKPLGGLTNLRALYVTDCKITGAGLKDLGGLTKLQDLRLNGNPVTDAGLVHLKGVRGLKDLFLTGTKVTDDGVVELKKALPKTSIRDYAGDEVSLAKKGPAPARVQVEDITKIAAAFSLPAEKFCLQYKEDQSAATRKYKGHVIELSGVVKSFGRNISEDAFVSLEAGKDLFGVMCFTAETEPWSKVVPGQKVKLKGKWPDFSVGATLIYCVFVETGPSQAIVLSADQLAKEYAANQEATTKKYDNKYLIITGEIVDREFNSAGAASIFLKGDGKVRVNCSFTAFEKKQTKPMKVGQKVKVIGQYTLNFDKDQVGLYFCLPLKQ